MSDITLIDFKAVLSADGSIRFDGSELPFLEDYAKEVSSAVCQKTLSFVQQTNIKNTAEFKQSQKVC